MMRAWFFACSLLVWSSTSRAECEGEFPNFIADICWSCMFPLRLGGQAVWETGQLDNDSSSQALCSCGLPAKFGLVVSFWEPVRVVEVTRTPYCLVTLGGLELGDGLPAREPGARTGSAGAEGTVSYAFYHVHWYENPLLHWLGVLLDFDCIERAGFDLAYVSELDPSWEDDQLAAILTPEMALTSNLAGVAACAADCVATTLGWPRSELWWCAGCTGLLYPSTGNVAAHVSGRQSSALLTARLAMRMHRSGAAAYTHGEQALCKAGWISPAFHKEAYKATMIAPRAQAKIAGRCCQPFGTSPELWASGSEWPVTGEDFAYLLYRKRDCCAGLRGL